jgi:hypothetical protein
MTRRTWKRTRYPKGLGDSAQQQPHKTLKDEYDERTAIIHENHDPHDNLKSRDLDPTTRVVIHPCQSILYGSTLIPFATCCERKLNYVSAFWVMGGRIPSRRKASGD